jgi:hypothetical protein
VTLEEAATGFSVAAPPDFQLSFKPENGVYTLRSDTRDITFQCAWVSGDGSALDAARRASDGTHLTTVSEEHNPDWAQIETTTEEGRPWTVQVQRDHTGVMKVAAYGREGGVTRSPEEQVEDERVLAKLFASAHGGAVIHVPRPPAPVAAQAAPAQAAPAPPAPAPPPIGLKDLVADDGSASGKVPDEPGWSSGAAGGMLSASNPDRGELMMGFNSMITLPGGSFDIAMRTFGFVPKGTIVAPLMPAQQALVELWPRVRNELEPQLALAGVQVEGAYHVTTNAWGGSGVFSVRFTRAGRPWRGRVSIATVQNPLDDQWRLYYSSIAVPDGGDPRVWDALDAGWRAFHAGPRPEPEIEQEIRAERKRADDVVFSGLQDINKSLRDTYWPEPKK